MSAPMRLHHFKIFTKNGWKFTKKMVNNLQFQLFAFQKLKDYNHWVLRNGSAIFVITEPHRPNNDGRLSNQQCLHEHSFPRLGYVNSNVVASGRPTDRPRITDQFKQLIKQEGNHSIHFNNAKFDVESPKSYLNLTKNNSCMQKVKTQRLSESFLYRPRSNTNKLNNTSTYASTKKENLDNKFINSSIHTQSNSDSSFPKQNKLIDSVYDVAFHVQNVEQSFEKAVYGGAEPICEPTIIKDDVGRVSIASVRSCVGDVVHTLLNTSQYNGIFLPGFSQYHLDDNLRDTKIEQDTQVHFDHVTYVCPIGNSENVLNWYENCFGMKRLKINSNEDDEEGFVVRGKDVGMRLKAMEYWRCNKTRFATTDNASDFPTNFVVAEALPGQGKNQIDTFLKEHNGPGVQHIGLHTPDLAHTTESLRKSGVEFIRPPKAYYTEVGKLDEILGAGQEVENLEKHGILLDTEADAVKSHDDGGDNSTQRYLMQVFTKPLFHEETFFLEYIQRCGARGFGAGNITALWRAVQQYMDPPSAD